MTITPAEAKNDESESNESSSEEGSEDEDEDEAHDVAEWEGVKKGDQGWDGEPITAPGREIIWLVCDTLIMVNIKIPY